MDTNKYNTYKGFIKLITYLPILVLLIGLNTGFYTNLFGVISLLVIIGLLILLEINLRKECKELLTIFHKVLLSTLLWFGGYCLLIVLMVSAAYDPNTVGGVSNNGILVIFVFLPVSFIAYIIFVFIKSSRIKKYFID